ncbi:uncharacterized protein LOC144664135 [Oculina patagonica]
MDGVVSSATLHSPHGLETFGRTLFVCDSGNKVIRMITNGKPFKKLSDVFYKYAELFNLDHYRGPPRFSFDQGISIIDNVVAFLLTWGEETRERTGRTATQGPDQIIPHCTRRSFQLIHIYAISFGRSVRLHTVRVKSKEETGQLPYSVRCTNFDLIARVMILRR